MELGRFAKPPGATLEPDARVAWEKLGRNAIAYPKKDGWRFQIQIEGQRILFYSRTGKDYANVFPSTVHLLAQQVGEQQVILDVEMVGYDNDDRALPPERLRKASHHRCWVLDMLYLNGHDMTDEPASKRIEQLGDWLGRHPGPVLVGSEFHRFTDLDSWLRFFGQCLQDGLEGAILKIADSSYFMPVYKVKPFETIDVIVLAGNRDWSGESNTSLKSLLLGVPSADGARIAVLGTVDRDEMGPKRQQLWSAIVDAIEPLSQVTRPPQIDATPHLPSTWFAPKIVLEVQARANRNKIDPHFTVGGGGGPGYRFDRIVVKRVREDKSAAEATSEEDLIRMVTLPPIKPGSVASQLTLFDQPPLAVERGKLEVIAGCMFSGKTTELIERISALRAAGQGVAVFYPQVDTRTFSGFLKTHRGQKLEAVCVADAADLAAIAAGGDEPIVAIDEAQFFDEAIVEVCLELVHRGKQVIAAGLDLDFRGEPFGPMPRLLACADNVTKLKAACSICGEPAFLSQRLPDGQPATFFERVVLPGGTALYQPRCREHHVVPGRNLQLGHLTEAKLQDNLEGHLWDWLQRLRAIGQIGLQFGSEVYDRERYSEVLEIAGEMTGIFGSDVDVATADRLRTWTLPAPEQLGYVTPKIAVAAALFDLQDRILLVRRADDDLWALPGGWADVGYTPSENVERELYQETGFQARCDGLIGIYDGAQAPVGLPKDAHYTLLFHCQMIGGTLSTHRHEIIDAQFVEINGATVKQLTGGTAQHVKNAIAYHKLPQPAFFAPVTRP